MKRIRKPKTEKVDGVVHVRKAPDDVQDRLVSVRDFATRRSKRLSDEERDALLVAIAQKVGTI